MAEAVAKETVCQACGADIRPDSLFCYACGGSLEAEEAAIKQPGSREAAEEAAIKKPSSSEAWLRGDITDDGDTDTAETPVEESVIAGDPVEATEVKDDSIADKAEIDSISRVEVTAKSPKKDLKAELTTAASLRKKPKSIRNQRVKVVWEEHDNSPNVWFLAGATILTILGAVLFYLAMYLK